MIMIMTLCYIGIVLVAFQVIKIKPTPMSVAGAVLLGVVLLGGVVVGWNLSAPITGQMTLHRKVTQLLSNQNSKEFIKKIHVAQNQPVKKGDVLYEVEAAPNQIAVDRLTAQLAVSQQKAAEHEAAVDVAAAAVAKARAAQTYAKAQLDTAEGIQQDSPIAVAELDVKMRQALFAASHAAVDQALASQKAARFALTGAQQTVKATEAQLSTARLDLDQCVVKAPADGFIMNWQAVEGTMTSTVLASAQGTFMDMSETVVGAVFPQNLLKHVAAGDAVEIAFKSLPGQITTGKVEDVLEYTGEGQLAPSGAVPIVADLHAEGFLLVRILLDDEELAKELPLGGAGSTAIYTQVGKPFHVISKIVMRMKAWMNYAPI